LLAAVTLLTSCATPDRRREALDRAHPVDLADPRIIALAGALEATARDRRSLVGSAHVSLTAPDLRFSRPQRVALQQPGYLRMEILGLFNQVAAILTTDGVRYQLYEPGQAGVQEGVVSARLLWDVARVDLEPEEVVAVLLGAPWQEEARLDAARELSDGTLLLAYRHLNGGGRRIFEFAPPAYLTRVRQRGPDDNLIWEATYDDYRQLGDRAFAYEVVIEFPRVDANADFQFKTAELNRELPASAFDLGSRASPAP
jgi:hypothetical protein